ncbi:MAG: SH3 domain-containing protein [Lachnospiraceae bacterium]|nr:SH3 domain-containing protein [Lachnospiraceae bacterium]
MKKKLISVLCAFVLIALIAGGMAVKFIVDKYSYSKERVEPSVFYEVQDNTLRLVVGDELRDERLILRDGKCYISVEAANNLINNIFYYDASVNKVLADIYSSIEELDIDGGDAVMEGEEAYVSMEYVSNYGNIEYKQCPVFLQLYNTWEEYKEAKVSKKTHIRTKGGIKSPILCDLAPGEKVRVIEKMDNWSKVKNSESVIGYVENKFLDTAVIVDPEPVSKFNVPVTPANGLGVKPCVGFHSIGGIAGNETLSSMIAESPGINVIAPTWFSLNDSQGGIRSYGTGSYVSTAHSMGIKVWGVVDDFNYVNETSSSIDEAAVLNDYNNRRNLENNIMNQAASLGLDGINLDFEKVKSDFSKGFVWFVRELGVKCREKGITLSVDNAVPADFNSYLRTDLQAKGADYIIIMGYDEHWHGCGNPGSVASIDYVSKGIERTLQGVDASKVINAIPLYTILWKEAGTSITDEYISIKNQADFIARNQVEYAWDGGTCQNYAQWEKDGVTYSIWLEDYDSLSVKLDMMKQKGIAGVAVWRLGYGTNEIWALIRNYNAM